MKFAGEKMRSDEGEKSNTRVATAMDKDMKMTKKSKSKDTSNS